MLVEWKIGSGRKSVTSKNKVQIKNGVAQFNERFIIETEILFDEVKQKFLKRDSLLQLNLTTANKPDPKLVGRINVDLSEVINSKSFNFMEAH